MRLITVFAEMQLICMRVGAELAFVADGSIR